MKVLLVFDKEFPVDTAKLIGYLRKNLQHIQFSLHEDKFELPDLIVRKPETFNKISKELNQIMNQFDKIFCFTEKQFSDNYFIHEHKDLSIFSVYGWPYLTDLPISNGVVYFIIDYVALEIDSSDFRHSDITGCIYDFLSDKRGVDNGMRQAGFCANCLKRVSEGIVDENKLQIFNDLKVLINNLSECSRWNRDILCNEKILQDGLLKRASKDKKGVRVVIASPGDTEIERKTLLDSLEVKFRRGNHEDHCGFRIIVTGWEDLASQPGYPQDVINQKIIQESDFVVAIFRHKLGTPTVDNQGSQRYESGTVEELLQALNKTKKDHPIGMAYFFSKAPVISLDSPDKDRIEKDWKRLSDFKKNIQNQMIYKPYTESTDLLASVLQDLEKNIIDYIRK